MNRAVSLAVFLLVAGACSDAPTNISPPDIPDPTFASKSKWTLLHDQKIEFSYGVGASPARAPTCLPFLKSRQEKNSSP